MSGRNIENNHNEEVYDPLRLEINPEERQYLARHILKVMAERNETYVDGVEHEFYGHEHNNDVPPRKESKDTNRK